MKLLFLMHRLPCPADGGSKLRAMTQLRYLADRHDVYCAGFLESSLRGRSNKQVRTALAELRSICVDVAAVPLHPARAQLRAAAGLLKGETATEHYFASERLRSIVRQWAGRIGFDSVLAFSSSMAPLALEVDAPRRVLDLDDLDSMKWAQSVQEARWPMRWIYQTEAHRLAGRERQWMSDFDASILISQREANLITDPELRSRIEVVEASLPVHALSESESNDQPATPVPFEPVVGFVGALNYRPNVDAVMWFHEHIWPRVACQRPDATWWIVGKSPVRQIRRLDRQSGIRVIPDVPEVESYLRQMRVFVAPLKLSRGVQIKVLTAMEACRPCVATQTVADGLDARDGLDLLIADTEQDFARAVLRLLNDYTLAEQLAWGGTRFLKEHLKPLAGLQRLEQILTTDLPERELVGNTGDMLA